MDEDRADILNLTTQAQSSDQLAVRLGTVLSFESLAIIDRHWSALNGYLYRRRDLFGVGKLETNQPSPEINSAPALANHEELSGRGI